MFYLERAQYNGDAYCMRIPTANQVELMAAFNAASPKAIFEVYSDLLEFGVGLSPAFAEDRALQEKMLLTAFIQLLVIEEDWSYKNAKACYASNLRTLYSHCHSRSTDGPARWFIDLAQRLPAEMPVVDVADVCASLLEQCDWKEMKYVLRASYHGFYNSTGPTDLDGTAAYTLLAYLLIFTRVKMSEKISR